ncbi:MAG: hypothetical protein M3O70_25710 [Actinomycetota bacterium]|nr:hypothetical protein [Actinomycetota bacterium]
MAESARLHMIAATGLLEGVNQAFAGRCPWDACARVAADRYLCPLGDFTQSALVTVADHLRSYWHLMRTATPALTTFTVLRAAVDTTASLGWAWQPDDWDERHRRALLSTKRDHVTFTAGSSTDPKHRYPTERLGREPDEMASLLGLSMKGGAPKPTKRMEDLGAQDLYAVLSGAAHGSREVVGLVVVDTPDGGQHILPHRPLSQLTWMDAEKIISSTMVRLFAVLSGS